MRTLSRSLDLDFVSTGVLYVVVVVVVVVVTSAAVDFSCSLVLQRVTLLHSCISTPLLFSAPFIANVSCIVAWVCWWLACCLLSFADLERCSLLVVDRIDLLLEHRRRRCCNKPTALCYRHSLIPHPPHAIVVVVVVVVGGGGTIRLFELAGWASVYFQCDCERLLLSTCADSHRYKHHVSIYLSISLQLPINTTCYGNVRFGHAAGVHGYCTSRVCFFDTAVHTHRSCYTIIIINQVFNKLATDSAAAAAAAAAAADAAD
jgi:hypothetical protein